MTNCISSLGDGIAAALAQNQPPTPPLSPPPQPYYPCGQYMGYPNHYGTNNQQYKGYHIWSYNYAFCSENDL